MKFPDIEKRLPDGLEFIVERIAKALHEFWMLDLTRKGWRPALKTDQGKREHAWLVGWKRLPAEVQGEYVKNARALPWVIWRAGFELILTAREILAILMGPDRKQKRGTDGTDDGRPKHRRTETGTKPGKGGGDAVEPEEPVAARGDTEDSGGRSEGDTGSEAGGGGPPAGDGAEGGPGKGGEGS